MDFSLTEQQQLLQDTTRRFILKDYSFEKRRAIVRSGEGHSRSVWKGMADLGLLGVPFAEAFGGFAGSAVETMLVMEEFGRGLVLEPYLSSVILCGNLVRLAGEEAQKAALLPPLIEGRLLLAFAHGEPQSRYDLNNVETRARRERDEFILDGNKSVVLHGDSADKLIVSARTSAEPTSASGISLFIVDRTAPGVLLRGYGTADGMRAAEIELVGVRVPAHDVLGPLDGAAAIIDDVADLALAALCAEAVGAMAALHQATLEYLKTRQQFGVPIGRFQALQHRMVDMLIQLEQARSMALLAAVKADSPDRRERRKSVSAAKVQIGRAGRFIGQQAVQMHGGMGMTDELSVSHYFKRLTMIEATLGDTDHHLARFSETGAA
jgi:pimeloyl-CoA dehydrogenase small subunit